MRPARPQEHAAFLEERRTALRSLLAGLLGPSPQIVWEAGSGHGHFLTAYAQAHPEQLCIGVDIASERLARADRKRERARSANLHFVRADADDFLASLPPGARLTSLFILFPDPWPKRRHHKNRLVKPGFLSAAAERSLPGARLYFRTDHRHYFDEVRAGVRAHADWQELEDAAWPLDEPSVFQKRAERHFSLVAARR